MTKVLLKSFTQLHHLIKFPNIMSLFKLNTLHILYVGRNEHRRGEVRLMDLIILSLIHI